jgi:hypothetical protein
LQGERQDARHEIERAQAADRAAMAQALAEGREPPKQHDRHERAAVARRERLEAELEAADDATDEAGSVLARAIGECRDEWADTLAQAEEAAQARATTALAELQAAVADLGNVRRGVEWLTDFDVLRAVAGQETPFTGGAFRVNLGLGLHDEQPMARLLQIVAEALTPPAPARPRTHAMAVESR